MGSGETAGGRGRCDGVRGWRWEKVLIGGPRRSAAGRGEKGSWAARWLLGRKGKRPERAAAVMGQKKEREKGERKAGLSQETKKGVLV